MSKLSSSPERQETLPKTEDAFEKVNTPKDTFKTSTKLQESLIKEIESKKNAETKLSQITKIFKLNSFTLLPEEKYDYKDIEDHIGNIYLAFRKLQSIHPKTIENLGDIDFVLNAQGMMNVFDPEGGIGLKLIAIDYNESPEDIAQDILDELIALNRISENEIKKYQSNRDKNAVNRVEKAFGALRDKYHVSVETWSPFVYRNAHHFYDYADIEKNLSHISGALTILEKSRPDAIKALQTYRLRLMFDVQGINSRQLLDGPSSHEKSVISLDYNESAQEIADDIIRSLNELRVFRKTA